MAARTAIAQNGRCNSIGTLSQFVCTAVFVPPLSESPFIRRRRVRSGMVRVKGAFPRGRTSRPWEQPRESFGATLTCATALALLVVQMSAPSAGTATLSKCLFHKTGDTLQGSCGKIFDENRTLKLTRAAAITSGVWSKTQHPKSLWSGTMTEEGSPDQPIELEIYSGG
jgi:hypothetical protein